MASCNVCQTQGLVWSEKMKTEERFWSKVDFLSTGPCWSWTAAKNTSGYGVFQLGTKTTLAHRFAYKMMKGEIPTGLSLDHLCRNRLCVNPLHLEPVTRGQNVLRGIGIPVQNKAKTHCSEGHLLSVDNLDKFKLSIGTRRCKICKNASERARQNRKKAKQ